VQLCEACGTEIVDERVGVCPACGCMMPLQTTPTPTQSTSAIAGSDDAVSIAPGAAVPTEPDTGTPIADAVATTEAGQDGLPGTADESSEPVPSADDAARAEAGRPAEAHEPPEAAADGTAPSPPATVAAEPRQTEAVPATILGAAAAAATPAPQPQWHPDSLLRPRRRGPSRRLWLVIGGGAVVLIAAIVTIVLIVTAAVPQRIEGLALVRDLPARPTVGSWELEHPLADEVAAGGELYLNGYTAGPSTAVMVWSTDRPLDAAAVDTAEGETMISLVNTANGHTLWDRRVTELSDDFDRFDAPVVVSPPDATAIVLSQGDLMVSVSRRDGRVVSSSSEHSSVEGIGFPDFAAPAAFVPGLEGDLLVTSTRDGVGTVGRYRSTDLGDPVWQVTGDAGERATTAGDKLFFDGAVYSLDDGSVIDWEGDLSWYYQQLGTDLVAIDYSGNDTTIHGVDTRSGAVRWTAKGALPVVLDGSGLLVVADQSGEQVRRLDAGSGDVEWTSGLTSTWDGAYTVGDTIMLSDGQSGYTGISAGDGKTRYEEGDAEGSLVGYSERTLFLSLDGRLVGIDAMTGERLWTVPSAGDEYGFTAWGGGIVATASVLPAGTASPAVLGVSEPDRD